MYINENMYVHVPHVSQDDQLQSLPNEDVAQALLQMEIALTQSHYQLVKEYIYMY